MSHFSLPGLKMPSKSAPNPAVPKPRKTRTGPDRPHLKAPDTSHFPPLVRVVCVFRGLGVRPPASPHSKRHIETQNIGTLSKPRRLLSAEPRFGVLRLELLDRNA